MKIGLWLSSSMDLRLSFTSLLVKAMPRFINTPSSLMFSKKDQRFYVPTPGSDYLYSLDPNSKENDHPEFVSMFPNYFAEDHFDQDVDEMNSSTTTVHFVEAASGKQFFVRWSSEFPYWPHPLSLGS
ncbi:unnamed protein product [Eruca vesicaria subsp. sativa]|uniref:Uncharacterized protein n=1 Tax=Eruca vesicaria subsp. sativa TaxID=29727 RepID=A0ABC8KWT7_ERUVS|nr:unnamed protein product [Eruca vesicaria subsp. sativa]